MRRCTRRRGGERVAADSMRTERARGRERVVMLPRRKERRRKRNSDARGAEDVPIRTEMVRTGWRDASDEGERKIRERARARGVRGRASERENGGMKKREGNGEEREAERYREGAKERGREGESGRTRVGERRRASAGPAEGARRPHMCSETNVRSECRLLPIIRCRGVPLCARGWSADSVPRFYAARQPGPVRARGYPRKPRAKCVASRGRRDRARRIPRT